MLLENGPSMIMAASQNLLTWSQTLSLDDDQAEDVHFHGLSIKITLSSLITFFFFLPPSTGGYSNSRVTELIFITCCLTRSLGPDFCQRVIWLPGPSDNSLPHTACEIPPPFSGEIYEGGSVCCSLLPATSMIPFSSGGLLA